MKTIFTLLFITSILSSFIFISEDNNVEQILNSFSGDSLLELMQEPYKIKHLRHFIDRWTLFRSLHVKQ